jgi:hypothetical protein
LSSIRSTPHAVPALQGLAWAAALGLAVATLAALLFVAANDLVPRESPRSFATAFLRSSLAFYAVVVGLPLLAAWGLSRLAGRPVVFRLTVVLVGLGAVLLGVGGNLTAATRLLDLEGPTSFRLLAPAAFALSAASLLAGAALRLARWPVALILSGASLLLAEAAFVAEPPRAPRATSLPSASTGPRPPAATPLVFVGVDGADWKLIERLFRRGDLPNLAALKARGAYGELKTLRPTLSPALWNTMVTGRSPKKHGIEGFTSLRMAGVPGALGRTRPPKGLLFDRLYDLLVERGHIAEGPVVSSARRVPALWEVASAHGSPISVVSLWATWPAEPVLGEIVSERIYYFRQAARAGDPQEQGRLTWPEDLHAEVRPLVMGPTEVSYDHARPFMDVTPEEFEAMRKVSVHAKSVEGEFKYLYSMFETERRIALHLVERSRREAGRPHDLMVLFRIVDIACHRALDASELVDDHLSATEEKRRKFGRLVSEAYRQVDRALGEIVGRFGVANVVVVSDHGFEREGDKSSPVYQHFLAPPGIFLAAGPDIRPGPVTGLTIREVMPLLAALKGLPVADDLEGRLRPDLFTPSFLETPVRRIASYGRRGAIAVAADAAEADAEMLERLRALGYVH